MYNANRFIAMYCAAKNRDYASISLKDMEAMIRKAKDALYTFTSTVELRTTMVTETTIDEETGQATVTEKEITEIWKIYTIVYRGEAYFEDKIFALSDEQKELAENYVQNLSVFLGDGMMQGLLPAESADRVSLGDIRFSDGATQVVYYNQLDKRYADPDYPAPRGGQDQDTAQPRPADPADLPPLCVRRAAAVCGLLRKNCPP